ncbi:MAG TPA: transcriptional regulator [Candidatus Eremiobacteraceae bacterium]|nr:transcriptional regulator [Candidatus Eremiobacteraceae bacterium]
MTVRKPAKRQQRARTDAPFAYSGLERIFHERGRLAVCTCLVTHPEGMSFTELQEACGLTDGNLSRHLSALAEMDIVAVSKESNGGRPATICRITKSGRTRFLSYIDELETVVRDVHERSDALARQAERRSLPRLVTT